MDQTDHEMNAEPGESLSIPEVHEFNNSSRLIDLREDHNCSLQINETSSSEADGMYQSDNPFDFHATPVESQNDHIQEVKRQPESCSMTADAENIIGNHNDTFDITECLAVVTNEQHSKEVFNSGQADLLPEYTMACDEETYDGSPNLNEHDDQLANYETETDVVYSNTLEPENNTTMEWHDRSNIEIVDGTGSDGTTDFRNDELRIGTDENEIVETMENITIENLLEDTCHALEGDLIDNGSRMLETECSSSVPDSLSSLTEIDDWQSEPKLCCPEVSGIAFELLTPEVKDSVRCAAEIVVNEVLESLTDFGTTFNYEPSRSETLEETMDLQNSELHPLQNTTIENLLENTCRALEGDLMDKGSRMLETECFSSVPHSLSSLTEIDDWQSEPKLRCPEVSGIACELLSPEVKDSVRYAAEMVVDEVLERLTDFATKLNYEPSRSETLEETIELQNSELHPLQNMTIENWPENTTRHDTNSNDTLDISVSECLAVVTNEQHSKEVFNRGHADLLPEYTMACDEETYDGSPHLNEHDDQLANSNYETETDVVYSNTLEPENNTTMEWHDRSNIEILDGTTDFRNDELCIGTDENEIVATMENITIENLLEDSCCVPEGDLIDNMSRMLETECSSSVPDPLLSLKEINDDQSEPKYDGITDFRNDELCTGTDENEIVETVEKITIENLLEDSCRVPEGDLIGPSSNMLETEGPSSVPDSCSNPKEIHDCQSESKLCYPEVSGIACEHFSLEVTDSVQFAAGTVLHGVPERFTELDMEWDYEPSRIEILEGTTELRNSNSPHPTITDEFADYLIVERLHDVAKEPLPENVQCETPDIDLMDSLSPLPENVQCETPDIDLMDSSSPLPENVQCETPDIDLMDSLSCEMNHKFSPATPDSDPNGNEIVNFQNNGGDLELDTSTPCAIEVGLFSSTQFVVQQSAAEAVVNDVLESLADLSNFSTTVIQSRYEDLVNGEVDADIPDLRNLNICEANNSDIIQLEDTLGLVETEEESSEVMNPELEFAVENESLFSFDSNEFVKIHEADNIKSELVNSEEDSHSHKLLSQKELSEVSKRKLTPANVQKSERLTEFVRMGHLRSIYQPTSVDDSLPVNASGAVKSFKYPYTIEVEDFYPNDPNLENEYSKLLHDSKEQNFNLQEEFKTSAITEHTIVDASSDTESTLTPLIKSKLDRPGHNQEYINTSNMWDLSTSTGKKFAAPATDTQPKSGIISRIRSLLYSLTTIFRRGRKT